MENWHMGETYIDGDGGKTNVQGDGKHQSYSPRKYDIYS